MKLLQHDESFHHKLFNDTIHHKLPNAAQSDDTTSIIMHSFSASPFALSTG